MISNWVYADIIDKEANKELQEYPKIVRQLLYNRGINTKEQADDFLHPDIAKTDSAHKLYNTKKAAKLILEAIEQKKKIFIHGDFDVDGISATSILWDFLYRKMKADVLPYIPSRFDEGYGMSDSSIESIKSQGGEVIITVDCGIKDEKLIKKWSKEGLQFIVTDHHTLPKDRNLEDFVPKSAEVVVHPEYPRHEYPFSEISGATVVFRLIEQLVSSAELDFDPVEYLDLVALSIVCDVMPLKEENRILLDEGLKQMRETERPGLKRLLLDAGIELDQIEAYHLGFVIGPRLNASGRLDHAIEAVKLLTTESLENARILSDKLNKLNRQRQGIQEEIYENALVQVEKRSASEKLIFVWGDDWAEGVIGIVAGKLSENFHKPVLIASKKGKVFTGSARSISSFNVIKAINSQHELLDRFGGHPLAAGFTVKTDNIETFRDNLIEIADRELDDDDLKKEVNVEAQIDFNEISWDLYDWILKLSPFGYGNPKPKFMSENVTVIDAKCVGKTGSHLKLLLESPDGEERYGAIGFNLGEKFGKLKQGDRIDVLYKIDNNEWNGRSTLQLVVDEIKIN